MKAVGITCGIGSMLLGARQAGFEIVGNVEWRRYYHHRDHNGMNTFVANFPGTIFKETVDGLEPAEIERMMNADIALGHPECGNFSQLGGVNKNHAQRLTEPSDIPLFVDLVARFRPRFFVMDDLPRSLGAFPIAKYAEKLVDYDLFPEWVCNWGYGNVQRHRNRMFMIGSLKSERWAFRADEHDHDGTLESAIGDLPEPRVGSNVPNHDPSAVNELAQKNLSMRFIGDRPTWAEVAVHARDNWPMGQSMDYFANDGTKKKKPGCKVEYWQRPASVQDGGSYKLHPLRFLPLTVRERARIQGFPDDFVFYGVNLNESGEYNPDRNVRISKQTGKAMPIQFCRYVSQSIAAHIRGEAFEASGDRILRSEENIDREKMWYCENVGYADQGRACNSCWLYSRCTIRMRKYQIGEPVAGQRDLIDPGVVPGPDQPTKRRAAGVPSAAAVGGGSAPVPPEPAPPSSPRAPARPRFTDLPREEEYDI